MEHGEIIEYYVSLSIGQKKQFLAQIIFYVSELMRSLYPEMDQDCNSTKRAIRLFNEVIHRTSSQLLALFHETHTGYPDEAFVNLIFELVASFGNETAIYWAIGKAQDSVYK